MTCKLLGSEPSNCYRSLGAFQRNKADPRRKWCALGGREQQTGVQRIQKKRLPGSVPGAPFGVLAHNDGVYWTYDVSKAAAVQFAGTFPKRLERLPAAFSRALVKSSLPFAPIKLPSLSAYSTGSAASCAGAGAAPDGHLAHRVSGACAMPAARGKPPGPARFVTVLHASDELRLTMYCSPGLAPHLLTGVDPAGAPTKLSYLPPCPRPCLCSLMRLCCPPLATACPQSIFHVSYLRGLFPEKSFRGVDMKNLDGEGRWLGNHASLSHAGPHRPGGNRMPVSPSVLHTIAPQYPCLALSSPPASTPLPLCLSHSHGVVHLACTRLTPFPAPQPTTPLTLTCRHAHQDAAAGVRREPAAGGLG